MPKINLKIRQMNEIINKKILNKIKPSDFENNSIKYKKRIRELKKEAIKELKEEEKQKGVFVSKKEITITENTKIKATIVGLNEIKNHIIKTSLTDFYFKKNNEGTITYTTQLNAGVNAKRTRHKIKLKNNTNENIHFKILEAVFERKKVTSKDGKFEYGIFGTEGNYELRKNQIKF
jgi:hypothetical protein